MCQIWDSRQDSDSELGPLEPFVSEMLRHAIAVLPHVSVHNYRLEHREYVMGAESFVGAMHDDSCEYSVLYYPRIDSGIVGGELQFHDQNTYEVISSYLPRVGDLLVITGLHPVATLSTTQEDQVRTILIMHINSEED